jgi:hypothetical protein
MAMKIETKATKKLRLGPTRPAMKKVIQLGKNARAKVAAYIKASQLSRLAAWARNSGGRLKEPDAWS